MNVHFKTSVDIDHYRSANRIVVVHIVSAYKPDRGANPSFFRGGVLSAGPNFSTKDRLGECNSANYTSPRINGINSNTPDFNTCTCIQRTTKNNIYVL